MSPQDLKVIKEAVDKALLSHEKKIATVRGEALGAQLLASHALLILARNVENPVDALTQVAEQIDKDVTGVTFGAGDADLEAISRENARKVCDETLSSLRRLVEGK